MSIRDVRIGTKLELEVVDSYNNDQRFFYASQLLDIIDTNNIIISAPIKETRVAFIPNSTSINVIFNHVKYGVIAFEGVLEAKDFLDNVAVFKVKISENYYKMQRRDNYRLDVMLDAYYLIFDNTTLVRFDELNPADLTKTFTKNLSGSGACIITSSKFDLGTNLYLRFVLPDQTTVETRCIVVRSNSIDSFSTNKFNTGVKFTGINKKSENLLIKYIFNKQKDLLKQKK